MHSNDLGSTEGLLCHYLNRSLVYSNIGYVRDLGLEFKTSAQGGGVRREVAAHG